MKTKKALRGIALLSLAGLLLGPPSAGLTVLSATPVAAKPTEDDLAKVQQGMPRADVLKLMGKPDRDQEVRDADGLCRLYAYKKVGRYKLVNIWFDCNDRVKEIDKIG